MKFFSPEVALLLCKSTIRPCMEYGCPVLTGTPSCYLELLDKLQKRIYRTVGPSLAAYLKPLAHRRNVASLSLFYRYNLDVLQNWLDWFHFLFLEGGLLIILIDCMIFLSPSPDVTRMSISTVSFLAQLDSGILCLQNAFRAFFSCNFMPRSGCSALHGVNPNFKKSYQGVKKWSIG